MYDQGATADSAVAEVASRQHGVVSVDQLRNAGLDKHAVHHRVRVGRLHRVHRGVYAVGHSALSFESRWMAAVLACGRGTAAGGAVFDHWGAALSHRSAAELWGLRPASDGPVDVTLPGDGGRKRRRGIRVHRSITLLPAHVTLRSGIPVTTLARTIADLRQLAARRTVSGGLSPRELRRAVRQADVLGLPLGHHDQSDRTRSDLERDFLRLCRRNGLPAPEVNVRIGRHLVDFLWRNSWLVVETDGYRYHRGRQAFEDDRARDLDLRERGYEVIRLTGRQVADEPRRVAEAVSAALRVGADGRP
jgi:very-short-patch-repair endonuclease